jgi:hypothetical protein
VAQAYDGCPTMAGMKSVVAARFLEVVKKAVFVHCHAYKLNIRLEASAYKFKNADILNIIETTL